MRVDYLGLEAFVAVAELGSFSKAARRLNVTQTALSHRIRKIEDDLGTRLLLRTSREVSLTMAGQALLPQVKGKLEKLTELYAAVRDSGREALTKVVFACLPTVAGYYLAGLMRTFSEAHSGLQIVLLDQSAAMVTNTVQRGDAEFGSTLKEATPWDVEVEDLCVEPYVLLVNRHHPLAAKGTVRREDLLGEPLVRIRTQSTNRQLIEESLGDVSKKLDWRFEVQNAATAMNLVAAGTAMTVLPRLTMYLAPQDLVGLQFEDVQLSRSIVAVKRRGVPLSGAADTLLSMIRERLATM